MQLKDADTHPAHTRHAGTGAAPQVGTAAGDSTAARPPRPRRRRIVLSVVAVVVALAIGLILWLNSAAALARTGTAQCAEVPTTSPLQSGATAQVRTGVCATIAGLAHAWAEHDGQAYGGHFTEHATYTTFAGTYYSGRQDIADSHDALFDGVLEGTRLADAYLDLQIITDDVAILTTRGDRYEGDAPGTLTKVQTYTLVHQGDAWQVAAFQNTERNEMMERIQYLWMPGTRPVAER